MCMKMDCLYNSNINDDEVKGGIAGFNFISHISKIFYVDHADVHK